MTISTWKRSGLNRKSVPLHWLSLIYMYTSPLSRCLVHSKRPSKSGRPTRYIAWRKARQTVKPKWKQGSRQQVTVLSKMKTKAKRILYACSDAITDALNSGIHAVSFFLLVPVYPRFIRYYGGWSINPALHGH